MRLAALALCLLVAGCDTSPTDEDGSFSVALSGARTASLAGRASFLLGTCRNITLISGEASLFLNGACDQDANGTYSDRLRRGTFAVAPARRDDALLFAFYDPATRQSYRGTSGTVEITSESRARVTGRLDIEARPTDADNVVDTSAAPIRLAGTFDAHGIVGLD